MIYNRLAMSLTPTKPIPLGFKAPSFSLPDTIRDRRLSFEDIRGEKGTLVMFICNHCPFVKHVIQELVQLGKDFMPKGMGMVAISSNDVDNYPADHPQKMKLLALQLDFPFPYLYDEDQSVAMAYDAACTPDFNLFDANGNCVYRGQLDDSRPGNGIAVTGKDMRQAIELVLEGKTPPVDQTPSIGCNIKWK